jgi:Family of unknown function (DUF6049)
MARRWCGALLLVVVLLPALLVLGAAPGSGASAGSPPDDAAENGSPRLLLRSVTNWVGPVGTFRAEIDAQDLPAGASVSVSLQQPVRDRMSLGRSLTGSRSGSPLLVVDLEVTPGSSSPLAVDLPITDTWPGPEGGAVLDTPGVYPVMIDAVDASGNRLVTIVTQLIRLPDSDATTPPLAVGLIIRQHQPQSIALDGSPYLDEPDLRRLIDGLRVLDEFPTMPFTMLPEATTLVDASGSAAPLDTAVFGAARATATHQLLASTYAPIAVDSWSEAGLTGELDSQFASGRSDIAGLVGTAPDPSIAVLDPTIGPEGLDVLAQHEARAVIVPSDQLPADPGTGATTTRGFDVRTSSGRRLHAIAADAAITMRLLGGSDPVANAQNALAELALISIADRRPARGLALEVPGTVAPATLRALLEALELRDGAGAGAPGAPLVSPVRLDDLFAITDVATSFDSSGALAPTVRPITPEEPSSLGDYPEALRATRRSIDGLLAMVPETPSLAGGAIHRALASGDRTLSEQDRSTVLSSARNAIRSVTDEIVMTPEQIVTLTSRSGKVPLNIENRLQVPAHVRVSLRSAKLEFPDGAEFDQVLAPGTTTRIDARVTTRASGAFPLEVVVTSPDSILPVTGARFTVRSTAISGIGLVISIGAGLFLLLWWIRHYRTARRASRLMGADQPAPAVTTSLPSPDEYAPSSDSNLGDQ